MIRRFAVACTLAAVAASIAVTAVVAQSDPIAARKAIMKGVGGQTALAAKFVKGEEPFDLAKAQAIFATYQDAAQKMPTLFPDTSKTGGETTAGPKIWEDMAGFKAGFEKLGADAKAAAAATKDLDTFKAAFGPVTRNCGGCHEAYRIKKS
jgi:cytochrome c556